MNKNKNTNKTSQIACFYKFLMCLDRNCNTSE